MDGVREVFPIVTPAICGARPNRLKGRVNTFRERYCIACDCRPDRFGREIFRRCLHPHAWIAVSWLVPLWPEYFAADRELIARVACARTLGDINEEIRDYAHDRRNHGWWRGRAHLRLSTRRLRALARAHLPTMAGAVEMAA